MKRRLVSLLVLCAFILGTLSACVIRPHVPPGQVKKQYAPGHVKKH